MTDIAKRQLIKVSDQILDYLLEYRENNRDFTFSLRERDSVQSDEKRLEAGQWFQGSDYIYVPLFRKGDTDRKIKTIGFVIHFNERGEVYDNNITISFKGGVTGDNELKFHHELANALHIELDRYNVGYSKFESPSAYMDNLKYFLDEVRPLSIGLLKKYQLVDTYVVSDKDFEKRLTRIRDIRKQAYVSHDNMQDHISAKPLNQILFGPPGTGKTYHSISHALKIINEEEEQNLDWDDRDAVKQQFDKRMEEDRIMFTTFHQSMSYEDFIEGIRPQIDEENENGIYYDVQPGLFKTICNAAGHQVQIEGEVNWDEVSYYKMSIGGKMRPDLHDWCINNNVVALGWGGESNLTPYVKMDNWVEFRDRFAADFPDLIAESRFNTQAVYAFLHMEPGDIVIVSKGNHIIDAVGIIEGPYFWDESQQVDFVHFRKVRWLAKDLNAPPERFLRKQISQMAIYQFYDEDVKIEALKAFAIPRNKNAKKKPYILIIDEINRGNVSQIFGELITLIEEDKRLGKSEALEAVLPYSREKFGVPANLYIIGTMNTADRSVEALDTALRRRFHFLETPSDPNIIKTEGALKEKQGVLDSDDGPVDLPLLLQTINQRIEKLLDRDHHIGHSYFLTVQDVDGLQTVFYHKIIPLLQEYFFGDYGKIGLVLGRGFVQKKNIPGDETLFADFDYADAENFAAREVYEIVDYRGKDGVPVDMGNGKIEEMKFMAAVQLISKQP